MNDPSRMGSTERHLPAFLDRVRAETRIPGIGAAFSVAGRRAFGLSGMLRADDAAPLTPDARFHMSCVVKVLLALATLELVERGHAALDDRLGGHLPELGGAAAGRAVTLRHLLSHTSGYKGTNLLEPGARRLTWPAFAAYLRRAPQFFRPGTVFNYEHSEAVLLAKILERCTGGGTSALIHELVLEPLRIPPPVRDTQCSDSVRSGHHAYAAASGTFSRIEIEQPAPFWRGAFSNRTLSLRELLTLAEALAGAARARLPRPSALDLMRQPAVTLPPTLGGPLRELLPVTFGLGAAGLRAGWLGNTGVTQGQCIGLRYDPARRIAVAVGLNAMAPHVRDLLLNAICDAISPRERAPEPPPQFDFSLHELAGRYHGGGNSRVDAAFTGGRLVCEIGSRGASKTLRVELALDEANELRLHTPVPQLSIGFFREPGADTPALMLGLNAYKRVAGPRSAPATHR